MNPETSFPPDSKLPKKTISSSRHHLFLCVGPDCCDPNEHTGLWDLLKSETKKLNVPVMRTKAACLRICKGGPWLVVYPEGIWYGQVDESRLRRILDEHIEHGRPVAEWIAARRDN